ncbi:hypothetical protein BDR26DRAFT_976642 [Obelidium mucronatum]|nr:hypothetical protein BDR26DRAFT_976642 [Obelidium mucronatum]
MDYTNQGTSEKPVEDAVLFEDPDSLYSTAGSDGGQPESHSPMNSSVTSHCPSPHQQSRHNNDNPQQQQQQKQSHRQHQCPYEGCAKVFGTVGTLKVHVATHTKERKFKCTLCPATYTTNNRLTVHMRGHTGEKPYHCSFPGCKYRAKQKCSLKVHGLTHMSAQERLVVEELNRRTIPCNECGKLYKTIESLDQHSWRDHGRAPGGI